MMDTVDRTKGTDMQQQQQPTSKQIVHVRGDSETELDLLFSVLNSRDQKPPNRSFREMNLPPSFFRPPDPKPAGYHSRENSLDGLSVANHLAPTVGARQPNMNVFHSRSHSSPAQLPLTLSVAPPAGASHLKQGSADSSGTAVNTGAVPVVGIGTDDVGGNQQQQRTVWTGNPQQLINNNKYIVNSPGGVWQTNVHGVAPNAGVPIAINSSSKQLTPNNPLVLTTAIQCHQQGNLGPLPAGWEQGVTAEGDVYYINHNDKTTSWYDPRIPKSAQKVVPVKASSLHTTHNTHHSGTRLSGTQILGNTIPVQNANEQLIRIELQKLQKEKERLLREQEDTNRKEQALLKELTKLKSMGGVPAMPVVSQPSSVHQMVTTGVDPFLGQAAFVSSVSEQNVHDSSSQPNNLDMSAVGNEMGHATGMEMPILGVDSTEPLAMDSDDLVSSLTVGDLAMDVQMMENIIQYI